MAGNSRGIGYLRDNTELFIFGSKKDHEKCIHSLLKGLKTGCLELYGSCAWNIIFSHRIFVQYFEHWCLYFQRLCQPSVGLYRSHACLSVIKESLVIHAELDIKGNMRSISHPKMDAVT